MDFKMFDYSVKYIDQNWTLNIKMSVNGKIHTCGFLGPKRFFAILLEVFLS